MQEENPLVSIIVITYNSAKYVLLSIDCAKELPFQNIELVTSDDCNSGYHFQLIAKLGNP